MELHIHLGKRADHHKVAIDDVDITALVLRSGFSIVVDEDAQPLATMQMRPSKVTVDGNELSLQLRPPEGIDPDDPKQVDAWLASLRNAVTRATGGAA